MRTLALPLAPVLLLAGGLAAQTLVSAPSGYLNIEAGDNNTIPWWAQSGVYQQIHDANDMAITMNGQFGLLQSIGFRKDGQISTVPAARSLDVQFTFGATAVSPSAPSSTFATNLGPTPQIALPFTTVNLPSLPQTSLPNPLGWQFPLTNPFPYVTQMGNLCWELRFLNNTSTASSPLDAVSPRTATPYPNVGQGCVATGLTAASTISTRSLSMTTGAWRNVLSNAPPTTQAVMWVGFVPAQITLPGLCSTLEFLPLASAPGATDASGRWDLTLTFGSLIGLPGAPLYAQFGWVDANLAYGVGLSNASHFELPRASAGSLVRIYNAPSQGGAGNENAQTGTASSSPYGLVTYFGI
ncbi:MAG: hypothetical protein IPM29_29900 [Planctomycetes bacterium]|nr:hypothetical protein [Planctomycetota bacterium]